ncbi:MAG: hypothetical protein DYG85_10160 [Chloroflexi bacterium CFX1]|nr:hypothetical protein [Chloroflexi bacterium CFX1]MCQ3952263.1 hypothetical protein [Chloroflexota bacterium]MDL1918528.1 hypothetical protein [Chloroflexi bacterium CFX5]
MRNFQPEPVSRISYLVSRISYLVSRISYLVSRISYLVSRISYLIPHPYSPTTASPLLTPIIIPKATSMKNGAISMMML